MMVEQTYSEMVGRCGELQHRDVPIRVAVGKDRSLTDVLNNFFHLFLAIIEDLDLRKLYNGNIAVILNKL